MKPTAHQKKPGAKPRAAVPPSFPDAPVAPATKSRKTKVPSGSERKSKFAKRFTRSHHLVFRSSNKTHRISLRLAAVLMFSLVAILIIANPLTQYLAQQEEIRKAQANLEVVKSRVESLEQEKALWSDPAFIQAKARERLGYVMPGQTLYTTPDPQHGNAAEQRDERTAEVVRLRRENTPFFITSWDSLVVAGQVGELDNPQHTPILNEETAPADAPAPDEADKPDDANTDSDANADTDNEDANADTDKEKENE